MYVTEQMLAPLAERYGTPQHATFHFDVDSREHDRIRSSQKGGRRHDFTLYIVKDRSIVVIAKHFYPPGLYRAPSGGLHVGEEVEQGIYREAREETGCEIRLQRFLLRTDVSFETDTGTIAWNSFVFQAGYVRGDFEFSDRHEIREVRLVSLDEFPSFARLMRQSGTGGFLYRAALHEAVEKLLVLD
ncbi:MAG TPA: NUDIX hydrolase [Candidatus Deferrimicrobium sp.]|nr:NUDIX hydrolase [Candidatus Deferrimicrobium sp.]